MNLEKKNKVLNYSIITSLIILVALVIISTMNGSLKGIMGNSVYNNTKKVGDIVNYHNSDWYVIRENDRSYTLLKINTLTPSEMGLTTDIVPYDYNNNCTENNDLNCHSNINEAYIGTILNYYQNNYLDINDLVTIDDYTIRLLNNDDYEELKDYNFLYLDNPYFTMISPNYSGVNVYSVSNHNININMVYDKALVRPVINISKSVIK